jgi:hypothetical protein
MRLTALAGAALCVLTACGGGSTTSGPGTTSSTASSTSSSTTSTSVPGGSTTPVSVAPTHPTTHLVAVRVARQEGADRIVFEFDERLPGYKVAYTPKPLIGTSGKETPLGGTVALVFRMEQASGVDLSNGFRQVYQGPNRLAAAGAQQVLEVAQVEDFEGVLTWAAGLKARAPFRVLALNAPPRLVIDVVS